MARIIWLRREGVSYREICGAHNEVSWNVRGFAGPTARIIRLRRGRELRGKEVSDREVCGAHSEVSWKENCGAHGTHHTAEKGGELRVKEVSGKEVCGDHNEVSWKEVCGAHDGQHTGEQARRVKCERGKFQSGLRGPQ
jgi:hypothetical protein